MVWVGQFGVVDGEAREDTPWVGIYRDEEPDADDASDLYVLLEPALPGSEEFLAEMKDAIGEVFHESKVSLTGGVLRALRSAHENLRDWNRRSLKEHRVAAGVSCLAIHANEAYLAQVGPARAIFFHGGKATTIEPDVLDAKEALGLEDDFYPDFRRFELAPGDRLLLVSPGLAEALGGPDLTAALAMEGEKALPEIYRQAKGYPNCAAVLLAATPGPPELPAG
jgi:serine/threonine protein phosphatase PrpC